jgi:hypothetical protein
MVYNIVIINKTNINNVYSNKYYDIIRQESLIGRGIHMKEILKDLLHCFILSLKIFLILVILGAIFGVISGLFKGNLNLEGVLGSVNRTAIRISCFGLAIAAIGFVKREMMEPLNYEGKWMEYFNKFNLVGVIFFISLFMLAYSTIIDLALFNIY